MTRRWAALATGLVLATLSAAGTAGADEIEDLRAKAQAALADGRAAEAVDDLEALADRGVVDARVSYDRGLAYAMKIREGKGSPGDLGRAAQGLEEARALAARPALEDAAARALSVVRQEVARRAARSDDSAVFDQGVPLGRSVAHILPEDAWAVLAAVASVLFGLGLFVRALAGSTRARIGGAIVAVIAAPVLLASASLALARRQERLTLREAVVVAPGVRPADERGIARSGAPPIPEAALTEVVREKPGWVDVRWGSVEGWVPSSAVREVAKP
jgi:hypothetical protein